MNHQTCETVILPTGTKVLETKTIKMCGGVTYSYMRRGYVYNTDKFEKDKDGAIVGRKYL